MQQVVDVHETALNHWLQGRDQIPNRGSKHAIIGLPDLCGVSFRQAQWSFVPVGADPLLLLHQCPSLTNYIDAHPRCSIYRFFLDTSSFKSLFILFLVHQRLAGPSK